MILSSIERNIDGTIGFMSDFWTLTAATEQEGYPASNLLTSDLNQKWVSWGQRASHNWLELQSDSKNSYRLIAIAGLLGIDRTNPSHPDTGSFSQNNYRVIIDSLYPIASRRRPPVETIVLGNLVGTVDDLNGPLDPPSLVPAGYVSTKMTTPDDTLDTLLIADFANYNATERPIVPNASHRLRLHYVHSTAPATIPDLEVKMRYSASLTGSALVVQDIEQTSEGWIFTYSFNASTFAGTTGRVGVQVTGSTTGTSTPLPIGIEWIAELGWGEGDSALDSWLHIAGISYPQIVELPSKLTASDLPPETFGYEIYSNETVWVYIELSDWIEQLEFATIPLGGFEDSAFYAGRLVISEGSKVDLREQGGYNRRKSSDVGMIRTRGGTLRGTRNALHWDEHDFNARIQSQSNVIGELETFFERAGMRNPVVLIPDETVPDQAVYGVLTRWELADVGAYVPNTGDVDDAEPYYDLSFSAIDARARKTLR